MPFGDGEDDAALLDAWRSFCGRLLDAAGHVFKDPNPPSGIHRADGFRYLTQNLGQAFDLALETKDPRFPAFHPFVTPTRKLGSDSADCVYLQAWIDGRYVYRVTGQRGGARFWNLALQGRRPPEGTLHEPFGDVPEVNITGTELQLDTDGTFELYLGGPERGPNWLPTTADTRKIFFRQFFDDWEEEPASASIERVGMDQAPPPPDAERLIDAMRWAGDFVHDAIAQWPDFLWQTSTLCDAAAINRFNGDNLRRALGPEDVRRGRFLTQMRWMLRAEEGLVVEFDDYDGFWLFTNEAVFGNSMDYRFRPVSYTPSRTAVDADGRVRLIMSHTDPGIANWIDTSGFEAGVLTFRSVLSTTVPELRTRAGHVDDLVRSLPTDSATITPQERSAEMRRRFRAIDRRYR